MRLSELHELITTSLHEKIVRKFSKPSAWDVAFDICGAYKKIKRKSFIGYSLRLRCAMYRPECDHQVIPAIMCNECTDQMDFITCLDAGCDKYNKH